MSEKTDKEYLDDPKKKKTDLQTENLLYNGETIAEVNKKKEEYKKNNLNENV